LGAFGAQIREKLGDGSRYGIKIIYFERDRGNAGILRQAKSLLEETFLMMNGDILLENIDLEDIYEFHKNNGGKGTLLLATVDDPSVLGSVFMKGNQITKFEEKPGKKDSPSHLINGGVYLFEPEVCRIVTPESISIEHSVFPALTKENALFGYLLDDTWIHLHSKEHYDKYVKSAKKRKL
jgi:NDP-sugar pyrophosphorylase family protein